MEHCNISHSSQTEILASQSTKQLLVNSELGRNNDEAFVVQIVGFHYDNPGLLLSCRPVYFEESWFSRELVSQRETQ